MSLETKFEQALDLIQSSHSIAISGHMNPDGDCIGACLGMMDLLKRMGKEPVILKNDNLPDYLSFLNPDHYYREDCFEKKFDLFILLDLGSINRAGKSSVTMEKAKKSLCFDHHVTTEEGETDLLLLDKKASSTCELIARFAKHCQLEMSPYAATALYTGLMTDSNRYLFATQTPKALRVGAWLMEQQADIKRVYRKLYQEKDLKKELVIFEYLKQAKSLQDGKILMTSIRKKDLEKQGMDFTDIDPLINEMKDIKGVEVSCVIKEYGPQEIRVSLRSKIKINVSEIAQNYGGGGHIRAAGFSLNVPLEEAEELVSKELGRLDV